MNWKAVRSVMYEFPTNVKLAEEVVSLRRKLCAAIAVAALFVVMCIIMRVQG